jgi:hypothetical protein
LFTTSHAWFIGTRVSLLEEYVSLTQGRQRLPTYVKTPNRTAAKAIPSTSQSAFTPAPTESARSRLVGQGDSGHKDTA